MEYTELKCEFKADQSDIAEQLIAILGELGFESFVEESDHVLAYIPTAAFRESELESLIASFTTKYSWKVIPDQNWNAVWESNFQPVTILNRCYIRAPFHPANHDAEFEIVIEPKMSFGTAHHETTALMIQYLMDMDLEGTSVLDMGCGTGILAILAALKGSQDITAIDNDEWAYANSLENIQRNNTSRINVYLGDAALLTDQKFDVIIANINRNILLNDMPHYVKCLKDKGILLLSGFYESDLQAITESCTSLGLKYHSHKVQNSWTAACYTK